MSKNLYLLDASDMEEASESSLNVEVTEEKPFNKCLHCEYLGNGCSGPNLNVMTVERACEFLQIRRMQLGLSYQKTADLALLSVVTVKRILSGKIKDPSFVSMQALSYALVADTVGRYPCAMHLLSDETERAVQACKVAQEELANKEHELDEERKKVDYLRDRVEYLKKHSDFQEGQLEYKDKLLEDRYYFLKLKDRVIAILAILLAFAFLTIFGALVIDRLNPDIGFFWTMFSKSVRNILFDIII